MTVLLAGFLLALGWLLLWRATTSQKQGETLRNQAMAHLLEIGLYKDHPRPMLQSLGALFNTSGRVMKLLFPPSVLFVLPALVVVLYTQALYSHRPVKPWESVVLSVVTERPTPLSLRLPSEVHKEMGPISDPSGLRQYWRLSAPEAGSYTVTVQGEEKTAEKTLVVGSEPKSLNPRLGRSWRDWVLRFIEKPLPRSSVNEIKINYPRRKQWIGPYLVHWGVKLLLSFAVWLMVLGLAERQLQRRRELPPPSRS